MSTADDKIIEEARKRFKKCADYEQEARARFVADVKFAEADSDNRWQWETTAYESRVSQQKPALTVNKTREHNLQILNDQRQNKSQIRIRPVGDGATFKSAEIFEGIVRHIEYQSRALEAYDSGAYNQIYGGWGYWRIETDYVDGRSFDQEIFIKREKNPLVIYLDPDIQEFDGSDARFGFKFRDRPRDQAEIDHPWLKDNTPSSQNAVGADAGWNDKDHVRECEYFRRSDKDDELLHLTVPGTDQQAMVLKSEMKEKHPDWDEDQHAETIKNRRPVTRPVIEWFKIVGDKVVGRNKWLGRYIPLVRVIGEETVIDGNLDRKGHTRSLKDPQRMYNWYTSEACAFAAGQTKTPYITPAAAVEGLEQYWNNANTDTLPYLPWNHVNDAGQPIPAPQKIAPPVTHSAALEGMKIAQQEMMMASGQYQSQFGENENAKSGIAIQTRQRQGDNATYHFIDHLAQAIEFTGRQLIDLIPKIYDTPRIIKIMAEDGSQTEVNIDPNGPAYEQRVAGQPASEEQVKQAAADPNLKDQIETIFNPSVGKYDVEADIGPAFATRRQEAFAAMTDIAKQNPQFMQIGGDLYFKQADFPLADELAERFKRSIPPAILGEAPPPALQQMQQQLEQERQGFQQAIAGLTAQLADKGREDQDRAARHELEDYKAETARMSASGAIDPDAMKIIIRQQVADMYGMPGIPGAPGSGVVPHLAAHAAVDQAMLPPPDPGQDAPAAAE